MGYSLENAFLVAFPHSNSNGTLTGAPKWTVVWHYEGS